MSAILRILVGVFAVIGAFYVAMLAFLWSGGIPQSPACAAYPVMEVASPDGAYRASVENASCPGHELRTTIDLWHVAGAGASNRSERIFESPSASRSDTSSYAPLQLRLTWLSPTDLQIRYPRGTKIGSRIEIADAVRIAYVETDAFMP